MLLVDLDPQANLTSSFVGQTDIGRSIEQLFDPTIAPDAKSSVQRTKFGGVDLIPSSSRLEPVNITENWHDADLHLSLADSLKLRLHPVRLSAKSFACQLCGTLCF